jgi:SAM-dependent methyltransferase
MIQSNPIADPSAPKLADMWSVSGQLLHTPEYRRSHAALLAAAIDRRDQSVLDAACGTGFPLIELKRLGFSDLTGADADADLLARFRSAIAADDGLAGWQPPLVEVTWQKLPLAVTRRYDVVLNVDAAIGFMDSWAPGEMRVGREAIFARVTEVLRNFHAVTRPGGRFFIGLQKNNHKGNTYYPMKVGRMQLGGVEAEAQWNMSYDWDRRIKTWVNLVTVDGRTYSQTRQSYLFDLAELADFLRAAGFATVDRLSTPDDLYEDILVAMRGAA